MYAVLRLLLLARRTMTRLRGILPADVALLNQKSLEELTEACYSQHLNMSCPCVESTISGRRTARITWWHCPQLEGLQSPAHVYSAASHPFLEPSGHSYANARSSRRFAGDMHVA
ncbi:hypothetical protein OH77DRAFT_1431077 [Trametes cingulata]|nr:hypothetical protein OH77DRAFT_1431077 [Trametes cingulata]